MITNGPARTFTQESVNSWFSKLSGYNWENEFSTSSLEEGRKLYKLGIVDSLDVGEKQVIFVRKINREESYSVIEWSAHNRIEFRTSLDDEGVGKAVAVAGIYELEELISEIHEEDPMLHESQDNSSIEISTVEDEDTVNSQYEIPYKLLIRLRVSNNTGLTAIPYWQNNENKRFSPYAIPVEENLKVDRSILLRFAREANDYGFRFCKESGSYNLKDWNQVAKFAEEILCEWDDHFQLEFSEEAALLKKGNRNIKWEITASNHDPHNMTLNESFIIDGKKVAKNLTGSFRKVGKKHTFLRGHGLVKIEDNQVEDFEWWKQKRMDGTNGKWPRYMLFSLFARKYMKTNQDGELAKWQGTIRDIEKNNKQVRVNILRPYQKSGVARINLLHELGCHPLLADEMGLGKTIQALALISVSKISDLPNLVVCPASVVPVWVREARTHFPNIKTSILSKDRNFLSCSQSSNSILWVASYTQLRRHKNHLEKAKFHHAILDEAQMIKNPKAKGTQACLSIKSEYRLALSGTPIENSALDLWTIFRFLMPGLLGSRIDLEKSLTTDSSKINKILQRQVAPFVMRRLKKDVATELPPKIETELPCQLNQEQMHTYRRLAEKGILEHGNNLEKAINRGPMHLFSLLTRLRQTCCDLSLLPGVKRGGTMGIKNEILIQKIHDLKASNSKAIVFSQFTSYLNILENDIRKEFRDIKILKLTGATRDRAKPVDEFQNSPNCSVMLASLKAAGLGVTLTAADYVFIMDPWWNPAVEEQAIDRAHRIGREKPTLIYRMIAQGTIEERVRELQKNKKQTFQQILGDTERTTRLSEYFSDLEELINFREIR